MNENKTLDLLHLYCAKCRYGRIVDGRNFKCECKSMTAERLAEIAVNMFLDEEVCPDYQAI